MKQDETKVDVLAARAYFAELAADIEQHGTTGDLVADLKAAHERRQAFAMEMVRGRTERAKQARALLCADIFGRLVHRNAIASTLSRLEEQRQHEGFVRMRAEMGL